ncbi:toxin HipA [Bacteroidia bacterium]|nr:toxin HipA [Bacteroidia bacterium]
MRTRANVFIWEHQVGAVEWDERNNVAVFRYHPDFVKTGIQLSPMQMPLATRNYVFGRRETDPENFQGLPGLLADSLPDRFGNTLIKEWLEANHRLTPLNPVERLCYIGSRGMGALEYKPVLSDFSTKNELIDIEALSQLADFALNNETQFKAYIKKNQQGLQDILKVGTSAGGARPKAIIAYNPTTGEVRSGKTASQKDFEHYLVKFDVEEAHISLSRVEYAYYLMALDCGIQMSKSSLHEDGKKAHFFTKRFDRTSNGEKLHIQTLAAIEHRDYQDTSASRYEDIFSTLRAMHLPYQDSEQLFRRMVFNVMARNQDDHVKNFSFLMDKSGLWHLAPAYDMTYAFDPTSRWTARHQSSVNGKRTDITREDMFTVGCKEDIKQPDKIMEQISDTVSQWEHYAQQAKLDNNAIRKIQKAFLLPIRHC